ncbi:hypothetical protein [Amycolatopsis sp. NPDC059657]|uniref:hypothetical protein n=1 Tax=Amycolatopsis sp. NPDC059657 TaxID=3346899 RepID=UPI003670E59C
MSILTPQRRRTIILLTLAVLLVAAAATWWAVTRTSTTPGLEPRTVQAGAVEVRMTPLTLDTTGAAFRVEFTTHSGALDLDPATASQLRVNDQTIQGGTWSGPGPGGHHRDGTLRFTTTVPSGAGVELRITGLPQDAIGTWTAP